jgi:hypothetical protein
VGFGRLQPVFIAHAWRDLRNIAIDFPQALLRVSSKARKPDPLSLMFSAVRQFSSVKVWAIAMLNLPLAAFRSGVPGARRALRMRPPCESGKR